MLKYLRNKETAKKILIGLAIIIIPAFVLWGAGSSGRGGSGPSSAGILFGKKVPLQEYGQNWRAVKNEAMMRYPNFADIYEQLDLENQAWDRLILIREAAKERIKVTDDDVINTIRSFPFLLRGDKFDTDAYERLLKNVFQVSPRDYEEDIRNSLGIAKLINNVTKDIKVTDDELLKRYEEENEKIKINYVLESSKNFADKVDISEEEIEEYYKNNSQEFKMPARVNIEYIEFRYTDYLGGIEMDDENLKQYYDLHKKEFEHTESVHARHILVEDPDKAAEILKKLKGGLDFQKAANEYSKDSTKENGGDLGFFEKGKMIPDFEKAAFSLNPGEISGIVKTQFGYHIIKVEGKRPSYTETFEEAKEKISQRLTTERAKAKSYTEAFRARGAIEEGSAFEKAAQDYKKPLKKTGYFSKQEIIPGIGWNPVLVKTAFNLKEGEVGPLISPDSVKSDTNYIIRLVDKEEPGIPPLSEVTEEIRERVKLAKINALAKESMQKYESVIKEKMEKGAFFKDAAASLGLKPKESEYITRADYIRDIGPATVIKEVFDYNVGEVSPVISAPGGACIAQLADLEPIDMAKFEEIKEEFAKQYLEIKKAQILDAWFSGLKAKANLVTNLQ
ncbi:MAG: peptidyl-prolyl cis-trans isomerase [Candidatus Omnitrophica bacterium]|nr:peptidyl-prolyl cis-trans isomerase [Candidatus Omnitrophota bacterium]MBU4487737.1 peptidyl-prolyl cis-trans isomerase [Candidatus Omnitrophota bacterium]MCG2705277.1 peptidyl-prolyl cis-trans isomerase [Candidatus Omnitrophota bacterium]